MCYNYSLSQQVLEACLKDYLSKLYDVQPTDRIFPYDRGWVGRQMKYGCEDVYKRQQYKCIADSNGGMVLVVSPNLEIRLTENKFNFKIQTSLKEVSRDARFLLGLKSANSFICLLYTSWKIQRTGKKHLLWADSGS